MALDPNTSAKKRIIPSDAASLLTEDREAAPQKEEAVPPDQEGAMTAEFMGDPVGTLDPITRSGYAEVRHDPAEFGEPALVPGENPADYRSMSDSISEAISPEDFIDALLTRDVVDLAWEAFRLRRMKTAALSGGGNRRPAESERSADPGRPTSQPVKGEETPQQSVKSPTFDLDDYERLDQLEAILTARRRTTLDEIFVHRERAEKHLRFIENRLSSRLDDSARASIRRTEDEFRKGQS